jgi:hypothetical protein
MTYYIRTVVRLKFGQTQPYSAMMTRLAPYMAQHGWRLVLALQPMLGDLTELIHIWEVAEFDNIRRALDACASDPEAQAILAPLPDLLHTEIVQIMVKTPYSP